jgi:hypothetical protein
MTCKAFLNAEKDPRFSSVFKATSSVVFLGTTHRGSPAMSSSLFDDPFEKTKDLVDADDPKTPERNKLEPLSKDSDFEITPNESLYASPFSEPGSEALLPLENGNGFGIAGVPATLISMTGDYFGKLTSVLRNNSSSFIRQASFHKAARLLKTAPLLSRSPLFSDSSKCEALLTNAI